MPFNSGSSLDSTCLYFQAVLKFLHGASLLESGNNDNAKYSEMNQAKQIYSSTAKLCEFCAHDFEKLKKHGCCCFGLQMHEGGIYEVSMKLFVHAKAVAIASSTVTDRYVVSAFDIP
ncbi:hypothetical protein K1719_023133 [Acacia pycnantha]|nr:hypothetical protein K1719_023133 [Acacia pycnantha]